jgi:hypothetical protein
MSEQTKTTLKTFFETGDQPNQAQFEDLIDSYPNIADLGLPIISRHWGLTPATTIGTAMTTISDVFTIPANELNANGQGLMFEAWGITNSNTAGKNWSILINSLETGVQFTALPSGSKVWRLVGSFIRINATTALLSFQVIVGQAIVGSLQGSIAMNIDNAFGYTFSSADSIELRAQAPTSGSVTFYGWNIKKFLV